MHISLVYNYICSLVIFHDNPESPVPKYLHFTGAKDVGCWEVDWWSFCQIVTINKPTPSFLQARCPSCCPTNNVRTLKEKVTHRWLWICSNQFGVTCGESSVCLEICCCFVEVKLYNFATSCSTLFTEEQFKECWVIWRRPRASWKDFYPSSLDIVRPKVKSCLIYPFYYFTDLIQRWLKGDCSSLSLIDCYVLLMNLF